LPQKAKRRKPRVVVDTSVLVAGMSGFREHFIPGRNPSADVLHAWAERNHFLWLITEDILDEYKEVLNRLRVRSNLVGRVVNLIRERAEEVNVRPSMEISPDPEGRSVLPLCPASDETLNSGRTVNSGRGGMLP
jgi:predicted nucleic acid-binding protein